MTVKMKQKLKDIVAKGLIMAGASPLAMFCAIVPPICDDGRVSCSTQLTDLYRAERALKQTPRQVPSNEFEQARYDIWKEEYQTLSRNPIVMLEKENYESSGRELNNILNSLTWKLLALQVLGVGYIIKGGKMLLREDQVEERE